ncbi:alanine racemase [Candidatus Pacearchaeota archaeon]|nr:alanine racemase [Candidatus Pacearchaeota archaeon]
MFSRKLDTLNNVHIIKENILFNLNYLKNLNPNFFIFPVLKSNSYGHGLKQLASILKSENIEYIACDSYHEALKIWRINKNQKILIIGYNLHSNFKYFDFSKIALSVYDIDTIRALGKINKKIKIHLKIDTGMGRQGIKPSEIEYFLLEIKKNKNLELEGVMSHLSDGDNIDDSYTNFQEKVFSSSLDTIFKSGFNPKFIHLSASSGILKLNDPRINAIRPGLAFYGYNPLVPEDSNFEIFEKLKPAICVNSKVVCVKDIKAGDFVSYGRTFMAEKDMKIAVIPFGYYEGLDRRLSNRGFVKIKGEFVKIIGRVCMNLTVVDVSNIQDVKINDEVVIYSEKKEDKNSIANSAKIAGTIPYVILTGIRGDMRRKIV